MRLLNYKCKCADKVSKISELCLRKSQQRNCKSLCKLSLIFILLTLQKVIS